MGTDALLLALALRALAEAPSPAKSPCAATPSVYAQPPDDRNASPFGNGPWYVNADKTIWAGWDATRLQEGGNKVLWIRPQGTELHVSGHRLDARAAPLDAFVPCCYPTGFQATGLRFPTPGCWEVKATAGASALTFVTEVKPRPKPGDPADERALDP
jgi:hypothetical protein